MSAARGRRQRVAQQAARVVRAHDAFAHEALDGRVRGAVELGEETQAERLKTDAHTPKYMTYTQARYRLWRYNNSNAVWDFLVFQINILKNN